MKKKSNYFEPFSPKIIITNIFMSVCVVIIVVILILIAQGYSLGEGGGIERSGLLELSTHPGSTDIKIDGKNQFFQGNFSKILSSEDHAIHVSKKGYDTWQGQAKIESGLVTSIDWIRLFPDKKQFELIADLAPARFSTVSPNHRYILYLPENSTDLQIYDLQSNPKNPTSFNLARLLSSTEVNSTANNISPIDGTISVSSWNTNNDILIIKWQHDELVTWATINLSNPSDSINLSNKFSAIQFADLKMLNDSATKIWALSNGEIRIIDTAKNDIPEPIADSVSVFNNSNSNLIFIKQETKDNKEVPVLYFYRENTKQPTKIKTLSTTDSLFALGRYWNKDWLAFTDNNKLHFYTGSLPVNSTLKKTMKYSKVYPLGFKPTSISINTDQRILSLNHDKQSFTLDINSNVTNDVTYAHTPNQSWLDDYLKFSVNQGSLHVYDFDGGNTRTILSPDYKIIHDAPLTIPSTSPYLYFFAQKDSAAEQTLPKEKDQTQITQAVQLYRLHL